MENSKNSFLEEKSQRNGILAAYSVETCSGVQQRCKQAAAVIWSEKFDTPDNASKTSLHYDRGKMKVVIFSMRN